MLRNLMLLKHLNIAIHVLILQIINALTVIRVNIQYLSDLYLNLRKIIRGNLLFYLSQKQLLGDCRTQGLQSTNSIFANFIFTLHNYNLIKQNISLDIEMRVILSPAYIRKICRSSEKRYNIPCGYSIREIGLYKNCRFVKS